MATLSTLVQNRVGEQVLIQLTNPDDGTAVAVNSTVLDAACDDAQGMFQLETGITPDTSNTFHVSILVVGVQYYLETYKMRDVGMMNALQKRWLGGLKSAREKRNFLPQTTSVLDPTTEQTNARPDMDRGLQVWKQGARTTGVKEVAEDWGDT